jgi:chemotaxis protein MotB
MRVSRRWPWIAMIPCLTGCAELQSLRERAEIQDKQIARLREENQKFEREYYDLNELRNTDAAELRGKIETLEREIQRTQSARSERERELEEKLRQYELQQDLEREGLSARLAQQSAAATQAQDAAQGLQAQMGQREAENQTLKSRITQLQSQIAELTQGRDALGAELEVERQKLQAAQSESEKLRGQVREIDNLRQEMQALRAQMPPDPVKDAALKEAQGRLTAKLKGMEGGGEVELRLDGRGLRIIVPSDLAFDKGTVILSPRVQPILTGLVAELKALGARPIRVEGHTDNEPIMDLPFADNWGLGAARADRVRQYLVQQGLEGSRLEVVTRAYLEPLADPRAPENRSKNRRVEIVVGAGQ